MAARIAHKLRHLARGRIAYVAAIAIAVYSLGVSLDAQSQNCTLFESAHAADVKRLGDTYDYISGLTVEDYERDPINLVVVRRSLPALEVEARTDTAPAFCDGKDLLQRDLGLPEPDPAIPSRPAGLLDSYRKYLRQHPETSPKEPSSSPLRSRLQ